MTRQLEEQLEEVEEHISQAKGILSDLSASLGGLDDANPDDDPADTGNAGEEMEAIISILEDLESRIEDLRETLQG